MADHALVEKLVKKLYEDKQPKRDGWADWLYHNHVLWVAKKAEEIAKTHQVDSAACRTVSLLHDISDAVMPREDSRSEAKSLEIAKEILYKAQFDLEQIATLVDDALRYHSCRNGEMPSTDIGKVLATADAAAHFQTSFYIHAFADKLFNDYEKLKDWSRQKIEKDFNNKIFFEDVREEVRPQYETLKLMFEF